MYTMSVPDNFRPTHKEKEPFAVNVPYAVKRITFNPSEANPGETLQVHVPKLNKNEVLVQGSLALRFDINLSGGHANNFLVQNVSRALVSQLVVKFGGTILDGIVDYDIYKIFTDLFLAEENRGNMLAEGIQGKKLSQIRSGAGDKPTSGVDAENRVEKVYGKKYRINLDHQLILTDHGVFYPQALYTDLVFEVKLAPASQLVKGSDSTKLKYMLTNIQLEYEMIRRENLANEATRAYEVGKEFLYDHVSRFRTIPITLSSPLININVDHQRRSMKGILILFVERYTAVARDSEKYIFPDLKKVSVAINGSPNMLYNNGIECEDAWRQVSRFFMKEKHKFQHMTLQKFYTEDKYGLLIDLCSMARQQMHGSGTRLVNTTDTHMDTGGSGTGILGHPAARDARHRSSKFRSQNAPVSMCASQNKGVIKFVSHLFSIEDLW